MNEWDFWGASNLDEWIDGAGGTLDDLAVLLVGHINRIQSTPDIPKFDNSFAFFFHPMVRLLAASELTRIEKDGRIMLAPLTAALLPHGIVGALSDMLFTGARPGLGEQAPVQTLHRCSAILQHILYSSAGYRLLPEALDAGLLNVLVACGELKSAKIDGILMSFLTRLLPASTVYYDFLAKMEPALRRVEDFERTGIFRTTTFSEWGKMKELARQRLQVLTLLDAPSYISRRACDNLQCGVIRARTDLRRCSGCQSYYYCSAECQRSDWNDGHRAACTPVHSFWLNASSPFSVKERAFLRALMQDDHSSLKGLRSRIDELIFMNLGPNSPFCTQFDYTGLAGTMRVFGAEDWGLSVKPDPAQWAYVVARMEKSRGRMGLHTVVVLQGDVPRYLIVPLRAATPTVQYGMRNLAATISPNTTWDLQVLGRRLHDLIQNDGAPALEIY
ncbi:hypothetical protein DFH09DRAFT_64066 [Mycena vulgaris]|nr:hypothetical protein DFH09DRAFT_64066 [Mycena vulgaris]